jgi:hypothetical protein
MCAGIAMLCMVAAALGQTAPAPTKDPPTRSLFGYRFEPRRSLIGGESFVAEGQDGAIELKIIKVVNAAVAREFMKDKMSLFQSIFEKKRVDYPGQHSRLIECPAEYKPQLFDKAVADGFASYFLGYANQNRVAGACTADLVAYRYVYALVYCGKAGSIYEVEGFFGLQSAGVTRLLDGFACRD